MTNTNLKLASFLHGDELSSICDDFFISYYIVFSFIAIRTQYLQPSAMKSDAIEENWRKTLFFIW